MSSDLSRAYDLLGVKPGFSASELKAAHRDLAKVWHPDRFLHDPRLQEKAQEKLKEINEAYELLSSGKTASSAAPPVYAVHYEEPKSSAPRAKSNWSLVVLIFVAVFAVTITLLLQRRNSNIAGEPVASVAEPVTIDEQATRTARAEVNDASHKTNKEAPATDITPVEIPPEPAVATVTLTIDPESGLIAKPECRLRSRMSYPSGSEPKGVCNLSHAPPPKDGKIKSAVKWLENQ